MKNRLPQGSSLIELAAGLLVVIPLLLYGIDAATLYMGSSMNADYCREACRAAANGPPDMYCANPDYTPKKRAIRVLKNRDNPKSIIRVSTMPVVNEQIFDPRPQAPFGGPVNGVVSVKTAVRIYPPFTLPGFPAKLILETQQTYPYTWVMPGAFSGGGGKGGAGDPGNGTTGGSIDGPQKVGFPD